MNNINYTDSIYRSSYRNDPNDNRQMHLPKTFSTRKGPLILFSEEFTQSQNIFEETPQNSRNFYSENEHEIKTLGDLRKSILEFGMLDTDRSNNFEKQLTFDSFGEKRLVGENLIQLEKIRPGFSAKRYLSNWSKIVL